MELRHELNFLISPRNRIRILAINSEIITCSNGDAFCYNDFLRGERLMKGEIERKRESD